MLRRIRRRRFVPRQQALVEQRAGPCPAAVISFNQTNMIEPRATLQWRLGHSLLLLVRNSKIHPSTDETAARFTFSDAQRWSPAWMRCVWQKKGLQTRRGAALVGRPSANPRGENGTQTLLWWVFGCLGGWRSAPRCNLCSQAGTRQEQRPAFAGQGPRLRCRSSLPQVQLAAQPTHPQLWLSSCRS